MKAKAIVTIPTPPTFTKASEAALWIAKNIRKATWEQGVSNDNNKQCALVWARTVLPRDTLENLALYEALYFLCPEGVGHWNDIPGRKVTEVKALFRKAAKRLATRGL